MHDSATTLELGAIAIGLAGGLALFLFGMEQMTDALKVVAGDRMRSILGRLAGNRFTAALTGAFVTSVIQSSSVTTVLVVGFISAGLMSLSQSVGVIMGSNVGTTITAQIVAFKVTEYALVLVAGGFATTFLAKTNRIRNLGTMLMGMGLIFFGMALMSEATRPLRDFEPFIEVMRSMRNPALAILVSAAFTALIQSSSATTGIVIVLAGQGFISLETGIAFALGANVGTCVTAWIAALGRPRVALRAAGVHVLFNVAGVLLWVGLIEQLAEMSRAISPSHDDLMGAARLAAETPRQIANAHTLFNLINTALFLPFTPQIAGLIVRLLPDRPDRRPARARPEFLDEVYLATPAIALDRIRLEIGRLGELVLGVLRAAAGVPPRPDSEEIVGGLSDIERLQTEILRYVRNLSQDAMSPNDSRRLEGLLASASHLQNIADTVGVNLRALLQQWGERGLQASDETRERIRAFFGRVTDAVSLSVEAVREGDVERARGVTALKDEISAAADDLARYLGARLAAGGGKDVAVYRFEMETVELLKRIYYFAKRMAKAVVEIEAKDD